MNDILKSTEADMKKGLEFFETELAGIQVGRAQPGLIDSIKVDAYGQEMTMKQVGTVSAPDPKTLQVQVWDASLVTAVEKAIRNVESLGLNPSTEGSMVRMNIPPMTEDRRTALVKLLGEKQEQSSIVLRNARHEGLKHAKAGKEDSSLTEDDYFLVEKKLDEMIREYQEKAQKAFDAKKSEIMTI